CRLVEKAGLSICNLKSAICNHEALTNNHLPPNQGLHVVCSLMPLISFSAISCTIVLPLSKVSVILPLNFQASSCPFGLIPIRQMNFSQSAIVLASLATSTARLLSLFNLYSLSLSAPMISASSTFLSAV